MKRLIFFIVLFFPVASFAAPKIAPIRNVQEVRAAVLTDVSVNTACDVQGGAALETPACQSFKISTNGFRRVTLLIKMVQSAATDLHIVWEGSPTGSAPFYIQQGGKPDLPVVALSDYLPEKDISGGGTFYSMVTFSVNSPFTRVRLWGVGADVDDKVSIDAIMLGR